MLSVPEAALAAAGLMQDGDPVRIALKACDGRIAMRASGTRGQRAERTDDGFVFQFRPDGTGVSARDFGPVRVALAVEAGRLEVLVPAAAMSVPRSRQPSYYTVRRERLGDCRDYTAGLHGAAYALALDVYRNEGHGASYTRAVGLEQLVGMFRNAGHRVEQVSARLWTIDGRSATLGDLSEAARRIDRDAVLVAEAA